MPRVGKIKDVREGFLPDRNSQGLLSPDTTEELPPPTGVPAPQLFAFLQGLPFSAGRPFTGIPH